MGSRRAHCYDAEPRQELDRSFYFVSVISAQASACCPGLKLQHAPRTEGAGGRGACLLSEAVSCLLPCRERGGGWGHGCLIHGSPEGTGPSPGTKASSLFLLPGHLWAPVTIARVTGAELRGSRHPLGRPTGKRRPSWSWRGRSRGRRSRRVDSGHARILPLPRRLTKEEPRPLPSGFQLGSAKRRHRRRGREEREVGGLAPASPHWGAQTEPHPAQGPLGGTQERPSLCSTSRPGDRDGDAPGTSTSGRFCPLR